VFAGHPSDVDSVVVGGKVVVSGGEHVQLGPPTAVAEVMAQAIYDLSGSA
jgi:hypothetical protein